VRNIQHLVSKLVGTVEGDPEDSIIQITRRMGGPGFHHLPSLLLVLLPM